MLKAPIPESEKARLSALGRLELLDTPPQERFDRITRLALFVFNVPISTITLVDSEREWYMSCQGLDVKESGRDVSFCGHALLASGLMEVTDTLNDERFKDNPMVIGSPKIRYYAGVALRLGGGSVAGTFCIKDTKPHDKLDDEHFSAVLALAGWAETELKLTEVIRLLGEDKYKSLVTV